MKLLLLLVLFFSVGVRADEFDGKSPFNWSATFSADGIMSTQNFQNKDLVSIFKNGVKSDNLKLSCTFKFEKILEKASAQTLHQQMYTERVWVECMIDGKKLNLRGISCFMNGNDQMDSQDEGGFTWDDPLKRDGFSLDLRCMHIPDSWAKKKKR